MEAQTVVEENKVNGQSKVECDSSSKHEEGSLLALLNPCSWFHQSQLDPRVVSLIYWHDVKKTGAVFGGLMVILISMAYFSVISVVSNTSLILLLFMIVFRVYKSIMQAVQKSSEGHPYKDFLELDTEMSVDKAHELAEYGVVRINKIVSELKRLFFLGDMMDSLKFGCLLWCFTYVGSWFNGLTIIILAVVAVFSLPKVYETNQAIIDQYVNQIRTQTNDILAKVKAALPIGNKEKTQ